MAEVKKAAEAVESAEAGQNTKRKKKILYFAGGVAAAAALVIAAATDKLPSPDKKIWPGSNPAPATSVSGSERPMDTEAPAPVGPYRSTGQLPGPLPSLEGGEPAPEAAPAEEGAEESASVPGAVRTFRWGRGLGDDDFYDFQP